MVSITTSDRVQAKSAGATSARFPVHPEAGENRRFGQASRSVCQVELRGPAGRLEALLNQGAPDARFVALVCHPHPLGGGSLHNKVVYHMMKVLNDPAWGFALPVLRFNFRGTGLSDGAHDGEAEEEDVIAGFQWLEQAFGLPVIAAGFSFGAVMALKACCRGERADRVHALAAIGLPLEAGNRKYEYPFLNDVFIPKLFLSGDRDAFAPAAQLRRVVASAADPKRLVLLPGTDHFFNGQLEPMQQELARWLKELFS